MSYYFFNVSILDNSQDFTQVEAHQIVLAIPHDWAILAYWITWVAMIYFIGVVVNNLLSGCGQSDSDKLGKILEESKKQTSAVERILLLKENQIRSR